MEGGRASGGEGTAFPEGNSMCEALDAGEPANSGEQRRACKEACRGVAGPRLGELRRACLGPPSKCKEKCWGQVSRDMEPTMTCHYMMGYMIEC